MRKRAQLLSVEFILTFVVFAGLVVGLFFYLSFLTTDYIYEQERVDFELKRDNFATTLFLTQGNPHNWHNVSFATQKPVYFGLSDGENNLNLDKLQYLVDNNDSHYAEIKQIFGFTKNTTDVLITTYYFNGTNTLRNTSLTFGIEPLSYNKRVILRHFFASENTAYLIKAEVFYE